LLQVDNSTGYKTIFQRQQPAMRRTGYYPMDATIAKKINRTIL
jgi:hypothetical protein